MLKHLRFAFVVFSVVGLCSTAALAQRATSAVSSPVVSSAAGDGPDVYRVNYYQGANEVDPVTGLLILPDTSINVVDPGTNGSANMCVDIYVFTPDEEMNECCGCIITPDQLITFSINTNLTANPATAEVAHSGAIKIVSSALNNPSAYGNAACDPTAPIPTPTLREWITHYNLVTIFGNPTPVLTGSDSEFSFATLSSAELTRLSSTCAGFSYLSGHGTCSCPANPEFPPRV